MDDLLTRLESAADGQERELLDKAYDACFKMPVMGILERDIYCARFAIFDTLLDAHAWTSAAEMLLPEGWSYVLSWLDRNKMAGAVLFHAKLTECRAEAPFPWAALASACVKAMG